MPNERPVEQPVRPAAEALHAAVCKAVALLNCCPEIGRLAFARDAHTMPQVFVLTLGDVLGIATAIVVVLVLLAASGMKWWRERQCKHNEGVSETMACDAICRKCGKNLGFIGSIREQKRNV